MGKIYYLMGKSSSGKDTLYKELKKRFPGLRQVILYTTRPIREGEQDGVEYHFVPAEKLEFYRKEGKLITPPAGTGVTPRWTTGRSAWGKRTI